MKKIFAILMTVAMLLSLSAVLASAALPEGISFTPGGYSADTFSTIGDVTITWDPEAGSKLDVTDGDMEDWAAADYDMITVDTSNMVYWVNDTTNGTGIPEGWNISTYFVADSEWFYIGFYVTDPAFAYGSGNGYDGDAFQVCIDFGGKLGDLIAEDPYAVSNPKNIFYSFSCAEDGAPLQITRQESDADGVMDPETEGVKGSAKKTENGWSAEFALSWQQLYDDYSWKSWDEKEIYFGGDQALPLKVGCCLYYLDRTETGGTINWAAGTTNGIADDAGTPQVSWTAYDNGINLKLPYEDGMSFNCEQIIALPITETIPEVTDAPETEAPETEAKTEAATQAPETEAATQAPADSNATETTAAATTEEGCASVVGFGAVAVLAAAAAFVALKKKD